jgi:hypothetical protein
MPRLMVQLNQEEFDRLRDRALNELRHPRHTARLLLREALELPAFEQHARREARTSPLSARRSNKAEHVPA